MATIKFLLGFFCFIVIGSAGHIFGRNVRRHDKVPDYQRIVFAAQQEIGTREGIVPNTGRKVSEYLRYVGIHTPAPWCAAWVSYVFGQAGNKLPHTAWSPDLFPVARRVKDPAPGLIHGIFFPSLKRIAHCGIIENVKDSWVLSIEGNTNDQGGREGDGVYRRTRHKRSIYCYADWLKL